MDEKVTLWTRQDIRSLKILEETNVFTTKREFIEESYGDIADHFIELYKWFVGAAEKKVPRPKGVEFPTWCSIAYENMYRPIEGTVCYVLEVPKSEIIYFDGGKWDYVLNHTYLPKDEEDHKKYIKEMEFKGFKNIFSIYDGKFTSFYPEEKQRIIDSWHRVFEIENWNIFSVQANIWEIRPEMIKDIMHYEGVYR